MQAMHMGHTDCEPANSLSQKLRYRFIRGRRVSRRSFNFGTGHGGTTSETSGRSSGAASTPAALAGSLPASMPISVLQMLIVPTTTLQAPIGRNINTSNFFENGAVATLSDIAKKERRLLNTIKSLFGIRDQQQLTTQTYDVPVKCESINKLVDMGLGLKVVPKPSKLDCQQELNVQLHKLCVESYGSCKVKRGEYLIMAVQLPHFGMEDGSLPDPYPSDVYCALFAAPAIGPWSLNRWNAPKKGPKNPVVIGTLTAPVKRSSGGYKANSSHPTPCPKRRRIAQNSYGNNRQDKRKRDDDDDNDGWDKNWPGRPPTGPTSNLPKTIENNDIYECPLLMKVSKENRKTHKCNGLPLHSRRAAIEHAIKEHEWCAFCREKHIDSPNNDPTSSELENTFYGNMKDLKFHVSRIHIKAVTCPKRDCCQQFGLRNAFMREPHFKHHYPDGSEFVLDEARKDLSEAWTIGVDTLKEKRPALFELHNSVHKCQTSHEMRSVLFEDSNGTLIKRFDAADNVNRLDAEFVTRKESSSRHGKRQYSGSVKVDAGTGIPLFGGHIDIDKLLENIPIVAEPEEYTYVDGVTTEEKWYQQTAPGFADDNPFNFLMTDTGEVDFLNSRSTVSMLVDQMSNGRLLTGHALPLSQSVERTDSDRPSHFNAQNLEQIQFKTKSQHLQLFKEAARKMEDSLQSLTDECDLKVLHNGMSDYPNLSDFIANHREPLLHGEVLRSVPQVLARSQGQFPSFQNPGAGHRMMADDWNAVPKLDSAYSENSSKRNLNPLYSQATHCNAPGADMAGPYPPGSF
ncbi:hypothetical protein EDC01DRAFT_676996 [Geopyxis carbonaria]|nr:hypothetical protein EDC01DRAFT_676996 [Geopyxis carbonaria]